MAPDPSTESLEFPVFPLPDFVLFPGVQAPLHIFEPRYRQMVDQALDRDGRFCMATLKPRMDQIPHELPMFYPLGCLCEIVDYEQVLDQRYNILVRGVEVMDLREVSSTNLYRMVHASKRDCEPPSAIGPRDIEEVRTLSTELFRRFQVDGGMIEVMFNKMNAPELVDFIAFLMPFGALQKISILGQRAGSDRCRTLIDLMREGLEEQSRDSGN